MVEQILFLALAFGAVGTTAMVILPPTGRNPLYSALMLVISFFFVAGLYVLLMAHLMAALQVLVYAGAIMVLFLFVIMLLNLSEEELGPEQMTTAKRVGFFVSAFVLIKAISTVASASKDALPPIDTVTMKPGFGTVDSVADTLFHQFLLPFELTSILLLVAVIGAVVLAKRTL
jgi:NADH-quinone oxidoreductase subunit J